MKVCAKCLIAQELSCFTRRTRSGDGLEARCKPCKYEDIKAIRLKKRIAAPVITKKSESERKADAVLAAKAWRAAHRERVNAQAKEYARRNPGKVRAKSAARHARKLQATPRWVTLEHKQLIIKFYEDCPQGYEVDHIVPLQGANVRGLHVIWNLQYLTSRENRSKSNKLI